MKETTPEGGFIPRLFTRAHWHQPLLREEERLIANALEAAGAAYRHWPRMGRLESLRRSGLNYIRPVVGRTAYLRLLGQIGATEPHAAAWLALHLERRLYMDVVSHTTSIPLEQWWHFAHACVKALEHH